MPRAPIKPALVAITSLMVAATVGSGWTASAQSGAPDDILVSKGIAKIKGGRYALSAEQDVFQAHQQFQRDAAAVDNAIAVQGDVAARDQAIIAYRNRIAFDRARVGEARGDMVDGRTGEEQQRLRGSRKDGALTKQDRAMQGLAKAKPTPKKEQRQLAAQVEQAIQTAVSSQDALAVAVRDVLGRYQKVLADPAVQKTIGTGKLEPSDKFLDIAATVGFSKKTIKAELKRTRSPGETPKQLTDAIAEIEKAKALLADVKFNKGFKGYAERNSRRDETIKAMDAALAKMKGGDDDIEVLAEVRDLHNGYSGRSAPDIRQGLDAVKVHLDEAVKLLHELNEPAA